MALIRSASGANSLSVLDTLMVEVAEKTPPSQTQDVLDRCICLLSSQGEEGLLVAEKMGVPITYVFKLLESKRGQELLIKMQASVSTDPMVRLKRVQALAIDVQTRLLLNGSDQIKHKISESLLDRTMGRAIQVTENRNLNMNIDDPKAIDRALTAAAERLDKLMAIEASLVPASAP